MKKKIGNRWHYYGLFVLFLSVFVIKNMFSVDIPDYLLMGILAVMVILGNRDEIIAVCILCIPLIMVLKCSYIILISIFIILIKYMKHFKIRWSVLPVMMLIIWELVHCFENVFSITALIGLFIPLILCFVLMGMDLKNIDYELIVRSLAICTCVMCVVLLGYVIVQSGYSWELALINMQRLGLAAEEAEEVTFSINPNTLGCVCILAMSGLLQLFMARKSKVTDFIFIAIMAISGILTVSRTFIILFIIMIFLFLIANKGSMRKKVKFSMVLIAGCFIVFVLLNTIFPDALMNLQERFLVDDISSGRDDLFGKYNDFILSSRKILLFGVGAIELPQKVTEQYDVARNVPHNGIQELIIAWGIIGFILFLWFFILLVRDVQKKNNYISLINYIPLILIFAKIQVGQFLTSDYTMLALAFVYLSLCQDFRQRKS